jgi:CYTH domain-containing protein
MVMWASATQVTGVSHTLDIEHAIKKTQATYNAPLKDAVTMIKLRKLKKVRFNVKYRGAPEGK